MVVEVSELAVSSALRFIGKENIKTISIKTKMINNFFGPFILSPFIQTNFYIKKPAI